MSDMDTTSPDTPPNAAAVWHDVIDRLVAASNDPDNEFTLQKSQHAFLSTVRPVAMINGYVVLAVPSVSTKKIIEETLSAPIRQALEDILGAQCQLAVSVKHPDEFKPTTAHNVRPQPAHDATAITDTDHTGATPSDHSSEHTGPVNDSNTAHGSPTFSDPDNSPQASPAGSPAPTQGSSLLTGHNHPTAQEVADATAKPWDNAVLNDAVSHDTSHEPPTTASRLATTPSRTGSSGDTSLNPRYIFDTFVIGSSNRFAATAAIAVAESPAQAYNPLFIWGGSGLGKTHLLHAIGNYARDLFPTMRVKYVSSEVFTNDYINSMRDDRQESFKKRYRNVDILMVDDVQFLAGKEGTQEEFFHTFNALHHANKQIILSSDKPPKQLTTLTDRLRTRFEGGLITDIQPPDLETRIAILKKKAHCDETTISDKVLELIASRFQSSIRELEGALIRVTAYSSLNGELITPQLAEVALRDMLPETGDLELDPDAIIEVAAEFLGYPVDVITGTSKTRPIAHARQVSMYLVRELTDLSLPQIGARFGGKDHTTVIYACNKITKEMNEKRETYEQVQEITQKIKSRASAPR